MTLSTTVDGLVSRVRRDAQATLRPTILTLATDYTAGGTALSVDETTEVGTGSILSIDTELFYVTSRSETTYTVKGAFDGTTAANHSADTLIEVDPRIPKVSLVDFANHEINSWGSELFRVLVADVEVNKGERTYEFDTTDTVLFLLDVRGKPSGANLTWNADAWPRVKTELLRDVPVADFASGKALQLFTFPDVSSLHVVYATPFDLSPFTLTTDLISDVGLTQGQIDVLEAGLRWRLLASGLIPRTNWQAAGMSRDAEEVTAMDVARVAEAARVVRDRRLSDEALELQRQWPTREG